MLHEIGLTDYYFKELLTERRDYLLLLINGICHLNLTEKDILFGNIEERDEITFKTVMYDIKLVSENIKTMFSNGFDAQTISKALSLDISYVNEVLNK